MKGAWIYVEYAQIKMQHMQTLFFMGCLLVGSHSLFHIYPSFLHNLLFMASVPVSLVGDM